MAHFGGPFLWTQYIPLLYIALTDTKAVTKKGNQMICIKKQKLKNKGNNTIKIFPCGKCTPCVITRKQEWTGRILLEMKLYLITYFVTLTYHEKDLPPNGELHKPDLQLFFKRLRKNTGHELRYFASGEYGSKNQRPHYHILFFTDKDFNCRYEKDRIGQPERLVDSDFHDAWYTGSIVDVVPIVTNKSKKHIASYVAGYVLKKMGENTKWQEELGIQQKEFILTSRGTRKNGYGGLGARFAKFWADQLKNLNIGMPGVYGTRLTNDIHMVTIDGKKYPTGRYLRDQIYKHLGGDQRPAYVRELAQHHRAMDQIEQAEILEELETESQAKARKAYKSYLRNRGL